MQKKIISIHVPKAGGTTMLTLWKEAFGEEGVMMDYGDVPVNPSADFIIDPIGWSDKRPVCLPEKVQVVHGHFRPGKYDLLKDVFRMTMLRHPVDNLISIYTYWKVIPPQPNAVHQYFLKHNLDILGLARLPLLRYLYSESYFGGWDMGRLDFIGRHETRAEDLQRLAKMLDIKFDTDLHMNNTEQEGKILERKAIMADQKIMNRLKDLLTEDIMFYDKYT